MSDLSNDDVAKLINTANALVEELKIYKTAYPPGHFYSPINNLHEISLAEDKVFNTFPSSLPGIFLNEETQFDFAKKILMYYPEVPFKETKQENLRYYYNNGFYHHTDGIFLFGMLRTLKPKRIIEIGSGFSSALMLDVNEYFFDNKIECTFIEPDPDRLYSLLKKDDRQNCKIYPHKIQEMDLNIFSELEENDIVFIDSSHVSKANSDVNCIFFEIFPLLKPGVFIHIHDIFYPFNYIKSWIFDYGRSWNEAYLLRAFLQYNDSFQIQLFNRYLVQFYRSQIHDLMPECAANYGGNFWMKRVR